MATVGNNNFFCGTHEKRFPVHFNCNVPLRAWVGQRHEQRSRMGQNKDSKRL